MLEGPAPLQGPDDSTGFPVGCKSACEANLDGNPSECIHRPSAYVINIHDVLPANSPNCCSGQYNTAATCLSSGVAYYSYFSEYSLAISCRTATRIPCFQRATVLTRMLTPSVSPYHCVWDIGLTRTTDESSGTALWTCNAALNANYQISFCPPY